jgi:TetR/AcrR family transcriptional regulator, transcriptional repressor for nem operon
MRYAPDRKIRSRKRLVAAAVRVLWHSGPERITVAALCREAGLTHGAFYNHFASKRALIETAIGETFGRAVSKFRRTASRLEPQDALDAIVDFYLSPANCFGSSDGCALPSIAIEAARQAGLRGSFFRGLEDLQEIIVRIAGQCSHGADEAEGIAASVVSEMFGALAVARAVGQGRHADFLLEASRKSIKGRLQVAQGNTTSQVRRTERALMIGPDL